MYMSLRRAIVAAYAAGVVGWAGPLFAAQYTFTNIFDTSRRDPHQGDFPTFNFPVINSGGTVAFYGTLEGGRPGIFAGNGGPLVTIADSRNGLESFSPPAISGSGTVAFAASKSDGESAIFTGSGGPLTTVVDNSGPFAAFGSLSFNSNGTIVFLGAQDTGPLGVFTAAGGSITPVVDVAGEFRAFGAPRLNNNGWVAVRVIEDDFDSGIALIRPGGLEKLVTNGASVTGFAGEPDLNNHGTVAYRAGLVGGGAGVFTIAPGGEPVMVADTSGPYLNFREDLAISDDGTVAFLAGLDVGGFGIFTGDDPAADRIIATGDPLFGSTVAQLVFVSNGMNDNGDLAFRYGLANGTQGIAVAKLVPEPGSVMLLVFGGVAMLVRRRGPAPR